MAGVVLLHYPHPASPTVDQVLLHGPYPASPTADEVLLDGPKPAPPTAARSSSSAVAAEDPSPWPSTNRVLRRPTVRRLVLSRELRADVAAVHVGMEYGVERVCDHYDW